MTDKPDQRKTMGLVIALIAVAIPFTLGKYLELSRPGPFDSGGYVYSAYHVLQGAQIGVDEKPSAKIGTLLVNMAGVGLSGFSETGPKLIQGLMQAGALVLTLLALRRLWGLVPAAVATTLAAFYLSCPHLAKYGNVKEQYMIACMMIAIACVLWRQSGGRWWWAVLAGAIGIWAPLFKETGTSVIAAIGLATLLHPLWTTRTWKQAFADAGLILGGGVLSLLPAYGWLAAADVTTSYWPYHFLWDRVAGVFATGEVAAGGGGGGYLEVSRSAITFSEQAAHVFRYYASIKLPILLSIASMIAAVVAVMLWRKPSEMRGESNDTMPPAWPVPMLVIWFLADAGYVWISPRSYEQYYLPMVASGSILGGYGLALLWWRLKRGGPVPQLIGGLMGAVAIIALAWPVWFGFTHAMHSGEPYPNGQRRRGYVQALEEVSMLNQPGMVHPWVAAGHYIREHSDPSDTIYVWGWYPGIYVQAQRLSSATKAFESNMHVDPPRQLAEDIRQRLEEFKADPPKFFVDTHKRHFPWDRPPLELWPTAQGRLLPVDAANVARYEAQYARMLADQIEPDEAKRFEAMKPLRDYIREHYRPVRNYGPFIIFARQDAAS